VVVAFALLTLLPATARAEHADQELGRFVITSWVLAGGGLAALTYGVVNGVFIARGPSAHYSRPLVAALSLLDAAVLIAAGGIAIAYGDEPGNDGLEGIGVLGVVVGVVTAAISTGTWVRYAQGLRLRAAAIRDAGGKSSFALGVSFTF